MYHTYRCNDLFRICVGFEVTAPILQEKKNDLEKKRKQFLSGFSSSSPSSSS